MLLFHGILTLFLLGVMVYDLTRYIIPNWMVLVLLVLWPVMVWMQPMPDDFNLWYTLGVGVAAFIIGIAIFALRWMGGGDVKLLAVLALWLGPQSILPFLVYMGALGGILALVLLMVRPLAGRFAPEGKAENLPRLLRYKEPVPYGVAIAIAFLIQLWMGQIPGLPVSY